MDKSDSMSDDAIERRLTAIGGPGYAEGVARLSLVVGLVAFLAAAVRGDERTAEALRHFQAGTRLYSQGRFPEALVEFAAANKLKPNAALLYDLGQTHRALGHAQEALSYFRAYVDAAPFAANHDEVVAKIQVVETDLRQRNQEQANVATRLSAAEAAQRTADELSLRARNLMAEAEEAKSAAHDAQARAQRGRERIGCERPRRDHRHVGSLAHDARLAERDRLDLRRRLLLDRIQQPVLEEDHGVVVVDRRPQKPARIVRARREHDLQPRHVHEPRLELLRMLRARRPAGTALRANRQRHLDLPARHVPMLRRLVDDLLEGKRQEILVHDLDDRPHPLHRRADPRADDRHLRDRRVAHALAAELLEQPLRHAHRAAHLGDVLAHQEHVVVGAHRSRERVVDCLSVLHHGHGLRRRRS